MASVDVDDDVDAARSLIYHRPSMQMWTGDKRSSTLQIYQQLRDDNKLPR